MPKTKLPNVGAGDPPSTVLIDHSSHAVFPTIDRQQLVWLTRGVDPGVGGSDPLKICRKGQSMFWPLEMSHSFIQNCCKTASFTASRMNSWTLSLHWSCLCSRCYHPYVRSAPSRQCPPINAFAAILGFKLSWPKTKLQNVGAGDPPWTILIYGVQVEGVEEFIYLIGSQQSSNGYCRPDIRRRIKLACSVMNSLESMELQFSQYQHQSTPVPSTDKVCSAQRYRNIDHLGRRQCSRIRILCFFSDFKKKHDFLRFFEMTYQKVVKSL